jgi:uncharacterized protein
MGSKLPELMKRKEIKELTNDIPRGKRKEFFEYLRDSAQKEQEKIPKIAFIGRTGVGKSSTLNALFNTNLEIHHTRPMTKKPTEIVVEQLNNSSGRFSFFDMPGIGEGIQKDKEYIEQYRKVLADCELAVWVVTDDSRDLGSDEEFIRSFLDAKEIGLTSRLVIGINKVDRIHPMNWDYRFNIPSEEQEYYINERILFVKERLEHICPGLSKDHIVAYSAKQHYRLLPLFNAMLHSMPKKRAWVLDSIKDIADYMEKVDPNVRQDPAVRAYLSSSKRGYYEATR